MQKDFSELAEQAMAWPFSSSAIAENIRAVPG